MYCSVAVATASCAWTSSSVLATPALKRSCAWSSSCCDSVRAPSATLDAGVRRPHVEQRRRDVVADAAGRGRRAPPRGPQLGLRALHAGARLAALEHRHPHRRRDGVDPSAPTFAADDAEIRVEVQARPARRHLAPAGVARRVDARLRRLDVLARRGRLGDGLIQRDRRRRVERRPLASVNAWPPGSPIARASASLRFSKMFSAAISRARADWSCTCCRTTSMPATMPAAFWSLARPTSASAVVTCASRRLDARGVRLRLQIQVADREHDRLADVAQVGPAGLDQRLAGANAADGAGVEHRRRQRQPRVEDVERPDDGRARPGTGSRRTPC